MSHHPSDSEIIARIGSREIRDHFDLTRAALSYWRKRGIPKTCLRPVVLLGEALRHDMSDVRKAIGFEANA